MNNFRSLILISCLAALSLEAQVTGSGTTNYIPIWTGAKVLGNSKLYQTGGLVGVGTTSPAYALDVSGRINASSNYLIAGQSVLDEVVSNLAVGFFALQNLSPLATDDTAVGYLALSANTTGNDNTALGYEALTDNTGGSNNTAVGISSLARSTTGSDNTAFGSSALINLLTGSNNTAIGASAGFLAPAAVANSIYVGSNGAATDSNVIRLGNQGTQTSFFAAGISGVNVSGANVVVNSNGQLGVVSSSRRFKEDIQDMGDASSALLRLRPVTFRYKQAYEDGSKPVDYGLIAEEVAEVYPGLAVKGADGQIQTIQYQKLTPLLLNEVKKQAETIRSLEKRLEALESALRAR